MDYKYILDRVPVRKTFANYMKLSADGSFWRGNCPLCKDKEHNLIVITDRKAFYCSACQEDGTVIDFVAKVEKCTVKQATQQLVTMCGIYPKGSAKLFKSQIAKLIEQYAPLLKKLSKS